MIYVILGMHKSGTTLVSQVLHLSGINMIDEVDSDISYDGGNKCERESTKVINHEILDSKGVFSLDIKPPKTLEITSAQREQIQMLVQNYDSQYENWGFKDPRTCLTYPVWETEMPEHKIIAIYRSPDELWQRYCKSRKKYSSSKYAYLQGAWEFIKIWCHHNKKIIDYLENSQMQFLVLNYSKFVTEDCEFEQLKKFVGFELVDCRDKKLYRNQSQSKFKILLDAFCFLRTFKFPHEISQEMEALNGKLVKSFSQN